MSQPADQGAPGGAPGATPRDVPDSAGAELMLVTGETVRVLEGRLHVLHEIEARQDRDLGIISLTRDDGREIDILVRHVVYVRPMR